MLRYLPIFVLAFWWTQPALAEFSAADLANEFNIADQLLSSSSITTEPAILAAPVDVCLSSEGCVPHQGYHSTKQLNCTLVTGFEFDSNVTFAPEFVGLGSGQDIDDERLFLSLFSDYRLVEQEDFSLGLISSQYATFHQEANPFDLQDYMGGIYANTIFNDEWIGGVRYEFHHTRLGYDPFANQHRLVPNATRFLDDGHVTYYYEFENQEFTERPLIAALDRDAINHGFGFTRAYYTQGGDGRLFYGYRYELANADGDDFDRDTHMVTARWERPIACQSIFDAEFRFFWDDYDNPNNLDFDFRRRRDRRLELRTGIQKLLTENSSVRFDYAFTDSDSNTANLFGVRFFDFARHVFSFQYIREF